MIKRVVVYILFGLLVLALLLYFAGVREWMLNNLHLNTFLASVAKRYESWSFKIPSIPNVPRIKKPSGQVVEIITALIWIVNILIAFVNFLIMLVNFLVMFFNTIISIVQFALTLLYSVKDWIQFFV